MKFEKKHWMMLIVGVVVLYLVWYFLIKKKKTESSYGEANSFPMIGKGEFSPLPMYNQNTAAAINESGYDFRNFGGEAYQAKVNAAN